MMITWHDSVPMAPPFTRPPLAATLVCKVNSIGTAANAGTWVGVLNGLFYDAFGPRPTLLIGSVLISLGYVLIWMAASHIIEVRQRVSPC